MGPVPQITDALDDAFYTAFGLIEPANKKTLIGLDVSGSMGWGDIAGMPLRPSEASAAMCMVTARTERQYDIMAFSHNFVPMDISSRSRLDSVLSKAAKIGMGGTDCALPMKYAEQNRIEVDTFVVYTDSETRVGSIHPHQALQRYRDKMGRHAKLVVVAMLSNGFSIADPEDGAMLDVVGFDTAAPNIISDFSRGDSK